MSILPPQKGLEIPGAGGGLGFSKAKNFKDMRVDFRKNPFCGGYGYLLEPHKGTKQ